MRRGDKKRRDEQKKTCNRTVHETAPSATLLPKFLQCVSSLCIARIGLRQEPNGLLQLGQRGGAVPNCEVRHSVVAFLSSNGELALGQRLNCRLDLDIRIELMRPAVRLTGGIVIVV